MLACPFGKPERMGRRKDGRTELGDLLLLAVGGLDAEETAEEEEVDFDVDVDGWELAFEAEDESYQTTGGSVAALT